MKRTLLFLASGPILSLLIAPQLSAALIYEYNAGRDPANANSVDNLQWEPNINFSAIHGPSRNRDFILNLGNNSNTAVQYNASPWTSLPGITGSYSFDGTLDYSARTGSGTAKSFGRDGLPLGGTKDNDIGASSTFEVWIRPNAISLDSIGTSKIIETGGNTSGLHMDFVEASGGVDVRFQTKQGNTAQSTTLSLTDDDLLSDYMQLVGVVDPASGSEKMRLYVNGGPAAGGLKISGNAFMDWQDGNNDAALAGVSNSGGQGGGGTQNNYTGDIAIVRIYDQAMSDAQVQALYGQIQRETVFRTSFEYSGGNPTVGTDAANLNGADGQIGTFSGTIPIGAGGDFAPELIGFETNPQEGVSGNQGQLAYIDRPNADGSLTANLSSPVELGGAMVSFDVGTRRNQPNHDKDYEVVGVDAFGNEAFHLLISTDSTNAGEKNRLAVVTGDGTTTTYDLIASFGGIGGDADDDLPNIGAPAFTEDDIANIILNLTEDDYTISFTRDGLAFITEPVPYNGAPDHLAGIDFYFGGGGSDAVRTGFILDNLTVEGFAIASVPEPSAFALAALGLIGVAWFGWRRRK